MNRSKAPRPFRPDLRETGQDVIKRYQDDTLINALLFDRHEEAMAMETFAGSITPTGERTRRTPWASP